jgi:acyl-CoA thioesterase FadM
VHVECDFFHPVTLDELLVVDAYFGKIGRSSIHLNFEVHRQERPNVIVATGKYVLVTVKKGQLRPIAVPTVLREKLMPYVEEERGTAYRRSPQQ